MDPKQSTKLDPKLQEAFDRVMGTPTAPGATTPTTPLPAANPLPPKPNPVATPAAPMPIPAIKPVQAASTVPTAPHLPGTPIQPPMGQPVMPQVPSTPTMHPAAPMPQPMSAQMPKPAVVSMPTPPITAAVKPAIAQPVMPPIPQAMQHPMPPQITTAQPQQPQMQAMHATAPALAVAPAGEHGAGTPTHGFVAPKKKAAVSPVILIFGGIVFLLAYTIFWLKFFNVPIPFITQ